MSILRISMVFALTVSLGAPAMAGDLTESIAKASEAAAQQQTNNTHRPIAKGYLWGGTALFAGGMGVAFYAFLHNQNTGLPGFESGNPVPVYGEATSMNTELGFAGLSTAFLGGTLIFLGHHQARRAPTVSIAPGGVAVAQHLSW